jgi:hypothetical protein
VANDYLKYTSRDYNSIYTDLVEAIPTITDLWTNKEDGDPGIVLVKLMSALGDMLSYYSDKQALEYYASTVTQRKNASKLFNLIGYHMHWYKSATNRIDVTNTQIVPNKFKGFLIYPEYIQNTTGQGEYEEELKNYAQWFLDTHQPNEYPMYYNADSSINFVYLYSNSNSELVQEYDAWVVANTIFIHTFIANNAKTINVKSSSRTDIPYIIKPTTSASLDSSNDYITATDIIRPGETHTFDVIQGTLNSFTFNSSRLRNNRYYFSESAIDESNIWLSYTSTESGNTPTSQIFIDRVDNLLTATDGNIHFEFGVDDYDVPYIELSSYWSSQFTNTVDFTVYYIRTQGVYGNITKDYLTTIEGIPRGNYVITHPSNTTPYVDSEGNLIANPGSHPQTAHQAYIDSLNYNTTFNTLVTIYDFERFCKRQPGISNTLAVDGQRANDINEALKSECDSLSYAQLLAYYHEARDSNPNTVPTENDLRNMYMNRKSICYNDIDTEAEYKPYGLNLHVVCGNFDTSMTYNNGASDMTDKIASMFIKNNASGNSIYWLYKIETTYTESADNTGDGRIAQYLDKKIRETKIINVSPEYAYIRVFPWRCCGTIHLKNPVTQSVADQILTTVMEHLSSAFSPANIGFGRRINYMDVINVIMDSHDMIRYFDAGLDSRKLIDIDETSDISYFNASSLMYYVQTPDGYELGNFYMEGNNTEHKHNSSVANPYYKILSIASEYIINN